MSKYIDAIKALDLDAVTAILEKGPKWLGWVEPTGKNALHYLCGVGPSKDAAKAETSLAILKLLLKSGMDINSIHRIEEKNCGFFPATPLWYAYTRGRNETLYKYLLKQGANPDNCMWAIAWYDDIAAAKLFIKHGAKLKNGSTPNERFLGAFGWRKFDFAYWLLTIGADVDAQDKSGNTALMVAVKRKDEENIARLAKLRADPNKKNKKGDSARSIAETKGPKRLLNLI